MFLLHIFQVKKYYIALIFLNQIKSYFKQLFLGW